MTFPITEHVVRTERHTTFYLACGAPDATPVIFVHGWPELSISWRHQLPCFASLGFRCIAPDMRGYGRSTVHPQQQDYALEHPVRDMLEVLNSLGREKAVWVGHDWGSAVVWNLASHHPERCAGVASLCVPYIAAGFAPAAIVPLANRTIYPEAEYPAAQWDYMLYYEENFAAAVAAYDAADPHNLIKALFRKGNPALRGTPFRTATVRRSGGLFGATGVPGLPIDADVLSETDLCTYAASLQRNGFAGPVSWYINHARNLEYASHANNNGRLDMPVLFLHASYDYVCDTTNSRLAEPMRRDCADLTEAVIDSGHWMAQERPVEVNAALARWLALKLPAVWPG